MLIQDTQNETIVEFQYDRRNIHCIHFTPGDYHLGYFW